MNEKSHVSMERRVCVVCGACYDTGAILLDKRLRASMERYTTTGWGLCDEHERLHQQGFVALVECDPERSGNARAGDNIKPEDAHRTGLVAHLKREAFAAIFNVTIKPQLPCVFVSPGVISQLQQMVKPN